MLHSIAAHVTTFIAANTVPKGPVITSPSTGGNPKPTSNILNFGWVEQLLFAVVGIVVLYNGLRLCVKAFKGEVRNAVMGVACLFLALLVLGIGATGNYRNVAEMLANSVVAGS